MMWVELIELAGQELLRVGQKGLARLEVQPIVARYLEEVPRVVRAKVPVLFSSRQIPSFPLE